VKSGRAEFEQGSVLSVIEKARRASLSKEQASDEDNRVKLNLKGCFEKFKTCAEFKEKAPWIYAKNSAGIDRVY